MYSVIPFLFVLKNLLYILIYKYININIYINSRMICSKMLTIVISGILGHFCIVFFVLVIMSFLSFIFRENNNTIVILWKTLKLNESTFPSKNTALKLRESNRNEQELDLIRICQSCLFPSSPLAPRAVHAHLSACAHPNPP